jgi:hypothetical protein
LANVVGWLISERHGQVAIPPWWAGQRGGHFKVGTLEPSIVRGGIWAHYQVGDHADGSWPALYTFLRVACGLDAQWAYDEAVKRATGSGGWIDVSDLTPELPSA